MLWCCVELSKKELVGTKNWGLTQNAASSHIKGRNLWQHNDQEPKRPPDDDLFLIPSYHVSWLAHEEPAMKAGALKEPPQGGLLFWFRWVPTKVLLYSNQMYYFSVGQQLSLFILLCDVDLLFSSSRGCKKESLINWHEQRCKRRVGAENPWCKSDIC